MRAGAPIAEASSGLEPEHTHRLHRPKRATTKAPFPDAAAERAQSAPQQRSVAFSDGGALPSVRSGSSARSSGARKGRDANELRLPGSKFVGQGLGLKKDVSALAATASKGSAKENLKKIMAEHEKSVEAERVARMRAAAIERGEGDDEGEEGGEGGDGPMDGTAAEGAAAKRPSPPRPFYLDG